MRSSTPTLSLFTLALTGTALVASLGLVRGALAARADGGSLGGDERYVTHVTTDKPIYRAGETLYGRALPIHALTGKPWPAANPIYGQVQIQGPKGELLATLQANAQDGVLAFSWPVPAGQSGGMYKARVSFPSHGFVPAVRPFEVRAYRVPRLKTQIVFMRDGYGPGDDVTATLKAERSEGGVPSGAPVTLVAMVDGREAARASAGVVGADGRCAVSFRLPAVIERGEGTLALVIEDGGIVETATKTIPILLQSVDLDMYPEGGDLVASVPTRLYVEARTPAGKPADIAAVIEDGKGQVVARLRTEHEGRGRVRFTPKAGVSYLLRIVEPAGVTKTHALPAVSVRGMVLGSRDDVTAAGKPVVLVAAASAKGVYRLTLARRERVLASKRVTLEAGQPAQIEMDPGAEGEGVLRATLGTDDGLPMAERLVFRQPAASIAVEVSADQERYVPGAPVQLTVRTKGAGGKPVSAVVGISVTDDAVREMLETRDHPPRLPVQVLLEADVLELADAHVYLDAADPKAPRAVDLLLGTQGWRRFAFGKELQAFLAAHGDAARRALGFREAVVPATTGVEEGAMGGVLGRVEEAFDGAVREEMVPAPAAVPPPPVAVAAPQEKPMPPATPAARPAEPEAEMAAAAMPMRDERQARGDWAGDDKDQPVIAMGKEAKKAAMRVAWVPVVREYAHQVRPGRKAGDRVDFAETVYWNAGIRTDAATGEAVVRFSLPDSVTTFRALADAFDADGALGAGTGLIESVQPFYLEPKLPLEVTYGDVIRLPVGIVNGTREPLAGVTLEARTGAHLKAGTVAPFALGESERLRRIVELTVKEIAGEAKLVVSGRAGAYGDEVTRTLAVKPFGFPTAHDWGGVLAAGTRVRHEITIPGSVVTGSLRVEGKVFPTSLGKLTSALERLIQEPNGCFEQTSSTTYPLVMAQQYFLSHAGVDPALVERSHGLLEKGYQRLTGFECKQKGYEWFGEDPGHEALSAFGLLEFSDMGKVRQVDAAMLERTRQFLLARRDGQGGFKRERRALHTWIEDKDSSNAYILWALLEAGATGLDPEVAALAKAAEATSDSYVKALAARVMQLAGKKDVAAKLMADLASRQAADGSVSGGKSSIVGSSGEALAIETTSLASIAWLGSQPHQAEVEKAIRFLAASCEGGRYGSTQATVLALRAIVAYDEARSKPRAAGSLRLLVDGQPIGNVMPFDEKTEGAVVLPDASRSLTPGRHVIEIEMERGSDMPYALTVNFNSETPATSPQCPVTLELDVPKENLREGDVVQVTALVRSKSGELLPTAVAIIGLPGGLEPRHEQLKELVKAGTVAAYEVIGREIVLYWRGLEPNAVKRVPLALVATIPGDYTAPASRAYLYYGDEHKSWAPGFRVHIDAL